MLILANYNNIIVKYRQRSNFSPWEKLMVTFIHCPLAKVLHTLTHEGRGIHRWEGNANISCGRFIEVKEIYLTDTPESSEITGKNSREQHLFHAVIQLCNCQRMCTVVINNITIYCIMKVLSCDLEFQKLARAETACDNARTK